MAGSVKTYRPKDLQLVLAGSYVVGGIVSIAASFPERYKTIKGMHGRNVRIRMHDTSCTLTVELLQTSTANDVLSSIVSQDAITGNGRLVVMLADLSGSTRVGSSNAFVTGHPETQFNGELATRIWTIQMLDTEYVVVGGNAQIRPKFLEDIGGFLTGAVSAVGDFAKQAVGAVTSIF